MKTINLIWWKLEPQEMFEYDWLNFLLSSFRVNHIVDSEGTYPDSNVDLDNPIIVASLAQPFHIGNSAQPPYSISEVRQNYTKELQLFCNYIKYFRDRGRKAGLLHLGDEYYKESTYFYQQFDFVFRQFYRAEDHKRYPKCYYLPLGYKSGFCEQLINRSIQEREYTWFFAGFLRGVSRHTMMEYAQDIPGGKSHITYKWNDENGLSTKDYAALLNNTKFALCPMGEYSVDSFRVYEALEAGAIPIVEAKGLRGALATLYNSYNLRTYGVWDRKFWLRNYQYWEQALGSDFPCPLIYNWKDLKSLINSIDVENTSSRINIWWKNHKESLIRLMQSTIEKTF